MVYFLRWEGGYVNHTILTINRTMSRFFDAHHVVNRDRARLLEKYRYRNIYYIPNGIDTSKFKPAVKEEPFNILFVGRLDYQKGFDIFIKIIDYLNIIKFDNIEFTIVGQGPLANMAKKVSKKYNNVKWLGYLPDTELIKAYQKAHVLVAPSRFEEFLIVSIEAQACGTPVVVSNIMGPRDGVVHGRTGFLVRLSVEEFIDKILFLYNLWMNSRDDYYEISKNARLNALTYDWNVIFPKFEKMLEQVAIL